VVELAGSPAGERLPRLVRAVRDLTGADAIAVVVVGADGRLQPGAASSDAASRLMHAELNMRLGPSITCGDRGRPVPPTRLTAWPSLAAEAAPYGISTADALPMRAGARFAGALTFYWRVPYAPTAAVRDLTQALADITAVGLVTDADVRQHTARLEQDLRGRVVVEQARGFLAAYHAISVDEALTVLHRHAAGSNRDLHDVAAEIVHRPPRRP